MPFRWLDLLGILVCMVIARSAAMAFNRLADRRLDALNPRTQMRHLPAGVLSTGQRGRCSRSVCSLGFVAGTLLFLPRNPLPLCASLPVLAFLFGYSYAKRFTALVAFLAGGGADVGPGGGLGGDPRGSGLAAAGAGGGRAALGGRLRHDLRLPGLRVRRADAAAERARPIRRCRRLRLAALCHLGMVGLLLVMPLVYDGFDGIYLAGVAAIGLLLVYEHWLVRPDDFSRVNRAFFHVNAVVSIGLLVVGVVDLFFKFAVIASVLVRLITDNRKLTPGTTEC